jgi:hypothetical protein
VISDIAGLLWVNVYFCRQTYNPGDTGCPFYYFKPLIPFFTSSKNPGPEGQALSYP